MNIAESIRIALQSLWANKLRSVLTLLGVVIGVAAVIAVVTFVNGINGYVAEKIFNLGADVFIVSKNAQRNHECRIDLPRRPEAQRHYTSRTTKRWPTGLRTCTLVRSDHRFNYNGKVKLQRAEQHGYDHSRLDSVDGPSSMTSTLSPGAPSRMPT